MKLHIDNHTIEAQPGQSLRELIIALDLERTELSKRPLAAKIADLMPHRRRREQEEINDA